MLTSKQEEITKSVLRGFILTFKKGDNIIYNLNILSTLYKARGVARKTKRYFNKPIIIILVSIIECILNDFVDRIQSRTADPLPNLTESQINDFKYKRVGESRRVKKLEKFDHYIKISQKHNIFYRGIIFYKVLNLLRDIRNRIHIQNNKNVLDDNEHSVFTDTNLRRAERSFEIIMKTMFEKYPRVDITERKYSADDFPYPWSN